MPRRMLYDCWKQIANNHAGRLALYDAASDRSWTFQRLAKEIEALPLTEEKIVHPQGNGAEFIFTVLQGWRDGEIVQPLEANQTAAILEINDPEIGHIKTTSGTSGAPRHVLFSEQQLAADARNIVETMELCPHSPNLGCISLAHSYGFSNLVLPLLLHGIPLCLAVSPLPEAVKRLAKKHANWTLPAVPSLWKHWLDAGAIPENVRLAISAGAPMSVSLEREIFEACNLKVYNFLGSSECGGIAFDKTTTPREHSNLAGTSMANVTLSISDDGCLVVESAAVGTTYWPRSDPQLQNGKFVTRDLATIENGSIFLHGRRDDVINVSGRKVSPESIEAALMSIPQVEDCLVFGVPSNDSRNEEVVACVVAKNGTSKNALLSDLTAKLPGWQLPRHWWFVNSLETNQRGKRSRAAWREIFLKK